jgi:hypothetical protein
LAEAGQEHGRVFKAQVVRKASNENSRHSSFTVARAPGKSPQKAHKMFAACEDDLAGLDAALDRLLWALNDMPAEFQEHELFAAADVSLRVRLRPCEADLETKEPERQPEQCGTRVLNKAQLLQLYNTNKMVFCEHLFQDPVLASKLGSFLSDQLVFQLTTGDVAEPLPGLAGRGRGRGPGLGLGPDAAPTSSAPGSAVAVEMHPHLGKNWTALVATPDQMPRLLAQIGTSHAGGMPQYFTRQKGSGVWLKVRVDRPLLDRGRDEPYQFDFDRVSFGMSGGFRRSPQRRARSGLRVYFGQRGCFLAPGISVLFDDVRGKFVSGLLTLEMFTDYLVLKAGEAVLFVSRRCLQGEPDFADKRLSTPCAECAVLLDGTRLVAADFDLDPNLNIASVNYEIVD